MRRVVVLLSLCAGLAYAVGGLGTMGCGGDPKPPLTPDEISHEDAEAGAPSTTPPPPAK